MPVDAQGRPLDRLLEGLPGATAARYLGEGLDNRTFRSGPWVLRVSLEPDPQERSEYLLREVRLLHLLSGVLDDVHLPVPVRADAEAGASVYAWVPGEPLLGAAMADPGALGTHLGELLHRLHAVDTNVTIPPADRNGMPPSPGASADLPEVSLAELAGRRGVLPTEVHAEALDAAQRFASLLGGAEPAVRAALAAPIPEMASRLVFSHNDLGAEHLLAAGDRIIGIIDWTDTCLTDPCWDPALVLRDLGPAVFTAVADRLSFTDHQRDRCLWLARCSSLADLVYGVDNNRPDYVDQGIAALSWLYR